MVSFTSTQLKRSQLFSEDKNYVFLFVCVTCVFGLLVCVHFFFFEHLTAFLTVSIIQFIHCFCFFVVLFH